MKRVVSLMAMVILGVSNLQAQSCLVKGTIENAERGKVFLADFHGDRFRLVDSVMTGTGSFYFSLHENSAPGLYRIIFSDRVDGVRSDNRFIEFIYNRESIEVYVASGELGPVPFFENSVENDVYAQFLDYEINYETQVMIAYGGLPDPEVVRRYDSIQIGRNHFMDSLTNANPGLYAVRMMNAFRAPVIPGSMTHQQRIDTLKACFFDHATIDDPLLLNAPVYSYKLIDYLSLFKADTLSREEQEEEFIEAVDQIMAHVSGDPALRSFVVEFLLGGFEMLGMERVQLHLAEQYLDKACESDIVELVLSRMEGYKSMVPGASVPDFRIQDTDGKNHQLSRLGHPYLLVIFWASTCEHCQEMLPELHEWYLNENTIDLEVVAISIDTSLADFEPFTEALDPMWITALDPLGWNGKLAADYYVYATPSLYLLDQELTIIARPASFRQFLRAVKKLEH